MYASDPSDRRKAGVYFRLTPAQYDQLKSVFGKLDAALGQEKESRRQLDLKQVSDTSVGLILVKVQDSEIGVPRELYGRLLAMNDEQGLLATASLISEQMPWLGESAAVLMATAIASSSCARRDGPA